jgi:N-acetylglucosaminyl-diphospho-decaprenol L-rhamnosyltransferase
MRELGIIIVTYNSGSEIGPCLDAALSTGARVMVVDNGSTDETLEQVRKRGAGLMVNPDNRGFAAAVNQGIREITEDYILLLNPDAVIQSSLQPMLEVCSKPGTGAVGGKLVGSDHALQAGFTARNLPTPAVLLLEILMINRLWPANPANWHYRCYGFDHGQSGEVEQPAGAFLMFRRNVWASVGGMDERFCPIWFEDVDFCKRLKDQGYRVYYEPKSVAVHKGGHSIQKILLEKRELYWYGSLLKYGFKHFLPATARGLCLAVIIGSLLRMALGIVIQRSFKPIGVYSKVIRLAGRSVVFGPLNVGSRLHS